LVTFLAVLFVAFADAGAFLPDDVCTLPTTATAPGPGMTVDSSPVDHLGVKELPYDAGHHAVAWGLANLRGCDANSITDCGHGSPFLGE